MSKGSDKTVVYFATHNLHKCREVEGLVGSAYCVHNLDHLNLKEEIPETGCTLEENSRLKAQYLYDRFHINCFADDTGLEVAALNNEPGVMSARYAGEPKSDAKNVDLLLKNLRGEKNRIAQFRTVITLIMDGVENQFEGLVTGSIIAEKRGINGFGYDPVFVPEGFEMTFAEMSAQQKNNISHRGIAIRKLVDFLKSNSTV